MGQVEHFPNIEKQRKLKPNELKRTRKATEEILIIHTDIAYYLTMLRCMSNLG
jgi:hypothetical protein